MDFCKMGGDGSSASAANASARSVDKGAALRILLSEGVGASKEAQVAFLAEQIQQLEAENDPAEHVLDDQQSSAAANDDARPRRRSNRSSRGSRLHQPQKKVSSGPPVDAARMSADQIKHFAHEKTSPCLASLDFVNVSNDDLETTFVGDGERAKKRFPNGV